MTMEKNRPNFSVFKQPEHLCKNGGCGVVVTERGYSWEGKQTLLYKNGGCGGAVTERGYNWEGKQTLLCKNGGCDGAVTGRGYNWEENKHSYGPTPSPRPLETINSSRKYGFTHKMHHDQQRR